MSNNDDINLPALSGGTELEEITKSLNVPRDVLASNEEIQYAWANLPRELKSVPKKFINEAMARMCIAVRTGLFDSALNYIWNVSILSLREKVKVFGYPVVAQIIDKDFDENKLNDLMDAQLLDLCLKLNLINEEGYFFLSQNREMRNNFSAAHPSMGNINDRELITFLNRSIRYALDSENNPKGINIPEMIKAIKGSSFNEEQLSEWDRRLNDTHEAQREIIFTTLHGLYCDPTVGEVGRLNSLTICQRNTKNLSPRATAQLLNRHSEYLASGKMDRHQASQEFFEKMQLLSLLDTLEQHSVIERAVNWLSSTHHGYNNFYNEGPVAERLYEISRQVDIPDSSKYDFVQTIAMCYLGNGYGISTSAYPYYEAMIKNFSSAEIEILLKLPANKSKWVGYRLAQGGSFRENFKNLLSLISRESVPENVVSEYDRRLS